MGLTLPDDWQWMQVSELANHYQTEPPKTRRLSRLIDTDRIETFVVIRCLTILAVASFHSGFRIIGGASVVLFVLAGYSFTSLQLPAILRDNHPGRVWALLGRLLVPFIPMSLIYLGLNAYRDIETHVSSLLLYRNLTDFIDLVILGHEVKAHSLDWLWFLHVYLQMFLLIGVFLSIHSVRRRIHANLWGALAVFFVAAEVVSILAVSITSLGQPEIQEAATLLQTSPVAMPPFLSIGALVAAADTTQRQTISFIFAAIHLGLMNGLYTNQAEFWWVAALLASTFFPYVPLPRFVSRIVVTVAAYSLMIYLTHQAAYIVFLKFAGNDQSLGLANITFQICFGVALGMAVRPALDWMGVNRLAERAKMSNQTTPN